MELHTPPFEESASFAIIRDKALELAQLIDVMVPDSEEQKRAIQSFEDAVYWTNASLYGHHKGVCND